MNFIEEVEHYEVDVLHVSIVWTGPGPLAFLDWVVSLPLLRLPLRQLHLGD